MRSFQQSTIDLLTSQAGINPTEEQKRNKEFWKQLWEKLTVLRTVEEEESELGAVSDRLDRNIALPELHAPMYETALRIFNLIQEERGIGDHWKKYQQEVAEEKQRGQKLLEELNFTALSATTNFRKVQVFGKIYHIPTDHFFRQNAWDLYRILKYTAGMTDLQPPKNVQDEDLAGYLDRLQENLIACFDHLIAKAQPTVASSTATALVAQSPI